MERSRRFREHGPQVARIAVHADGTSYLTMELQLPDINFKAMLDTALNNLYRTKKPPVTMPQSARAQQL